MAYAGSPLQISSHYNGIFQEYFKNYCKFSVELQIKLPAWCGRFAIVGHQIWVPLYNLNCVYICDSKTGAVTETVLNGIEKPHSVEQACNGSILVASDTGLYVVTTTTAVTNCMQYYSARNSVTSAQLIVPTTFLL